MALSVRPFGKEFDRTAFSSGQPALDDWFRHRAGQDDRRNVARVFVAIDDDLGIVGFYSLSSFSLFLDLPEDLARKLPRYGVVPAALIGRLARDVRVRGRGIGELLLTDAIGRILAAAKSLAVFAIVVDAKDEVAVAFYRAFGFTQFPGNPQRLFLPASVAAEALAQSEQ